MSTRKSTRLFIHIVLFTLFLLMVGGQFDYIAQPRLSVAPSSHLHSNDWDTIQNNSSLSFVSEADMNRVQLSYQLSEVDCAQPLLHIQLEIPDSNSDWLRSDNVRLNLQLGPNRGIIRLNVAAIITEPSGHFVIHLSPFLVNDQLQRDLLRHDYLVIDMLEPRLVTEGSGDDRLLFTLGDMKSASQRLKQTCSQFMTSYGDGSNSAPVDISL